MRLAKGFVGLAMFTGALLASSTAFADDIAGGIYVPTGPVQINQNDFEVMIGQAPGGGYTYGSSTNGFEGVGVVTNISNTGGANASYTFGGLNPPPYLYDEFSGFTVDTATTFADSTGLHLFFQNGQLSYYDFGSNMASAITGAGNADAAVAMVEKSGSLWLSLKPQAINAAGDTLEITITSGDISNLADGSGAVAYLDTIGTAPANPIFSTCTIGDTYAGAPCPAETVDFSFAGEGSNGGSTTFPVTGSDTVKSFVVPEPLTISLFGAGLIGAAGLRRRKAKKA